MVAPREGRFSTFSVVSASPLKMGTIDRRRSVGNTLATPMNPNKKLQGRERREDAVSLKAGDPIAPIFKWRKGADVNFESPPPSPAKHLASIYSIFATLPH